jgi:hypothetical protein
MSNLDVLGELLGQLEGLDPAMKNPRYIQDILTVAHNESSEAFDLAAASAASTGYLQHVFEYGNPGITEGKPVFHNPTEPEARLYIHKMRGSGGNQNIMYSFRAATQRNPSMTVANTGASSKYLRKLSRRKYVFWNRAFVMETGRPVSIKPKNGEFLFIPLRGQESKTGDDRATKRGFILTKKGVKTVPGRSTKGQFTSFWMGWWSGSGDEMMVKSAARQVEQDIEKVRVELDAVAKKSKMKPVQTTNLSVSIREGSGRTVKLLKRSGRRRQRK